MNIMNKYPESIKSIDQLDKLLSEPDEMLNLFFKGLKGDLMILGVGGKMGNSLASLAHRSCMETDISKRIIGVSRFSNKKSKSNLEKQGIETISCDLLDQNQVQNLPEIENIIYMAGKKFGTQGDEESTWASNVIIPSNIAQRFKNSRIVVFSTGCVYPLVTSETGGCHEQIKPEPIGEYAQSCLGRERIFQYYSKINKTKICIIRLNYAIDMRYGVLHDLAQSIYHNENVNAGVSNVNIIWQGDANKQAIMSLNLYASPAEIINITGPEIVSIKKAAQEMGKIMDKPVTFDNENIDSKGYLSNCERAVELFGYPRVPIRTLISWTAHWVMMGGYTLNKPTHFEIKSGSF